MKIHSIYYHNPTPSALEKMIKRYLRKGYRFLSMDDFREIFLEKRTINEKLCLVTLDDGWKGNLNLLPVIEKYHVPITIFVATEPVDSGNYWWEYITKVRGRKGMIKFKELPYMLFYRDLAEVKKIVTLERSSVNHKELDLLIKHPLVSIQSHTVNHPILTSVPDEVLDMELRDSKNNLEKAKSKTVYAFSYPNGSLSDREVFGVSKYYELAFTVEQRHISLDDNPYLLPRVALTGDYYKDILKIWGIWSYIKRLLMMFRLSS